MILEPSKVLKLVALMLHTVPARKTTIEMRITGLLPIHKAVGIQKRLETPSAKTAHEISPARVLKPTWNSSANSTKPVERPAAYKFPRKTKTQMFPRQV